MDSSPRPRGPRLSKSAVACQRCRRRKQRCDLAYPQCSNCEAANAECLSYHAGKKQEVPRNYFENLEAQIERLKKENRELKERYFTVAATPDDPDSESPSSGPLQPEQSKRYQQEVLQSLALVVLEPSDQPRFLGTSSGVSLVKVVMASIGCDFPQSSLSSRDRGLKICSTEIKSSLPPAAAATHLVDIYFQYRTPHFPVLDRAEILASVQTAYLVAGDDPATLSKPSRRALFVAFMVFAISLCGLQVGSGGRPVESEGCFHSAIQYLDSAIGYSDSDTETLGNILLLAQYISLSPSKGNLWLLSGIALRICVNIGLHWETDAALQLDPGQLNRRRRLFWATYHLERLLVLTLGRPFSLEEQSIDVGFPEPSFPSPTDVHSQLVANHLLRLSRLESEIKHVLYRHQKWASLAYPRPDYPRWMEDIQPRLEEWRASIPPMQDAHPESIYAFSSWWDAIYNNTLMLLHRPNPSIPEPGAKSLRICFDAATRLITCAQTLQRDHQLEMVWLWAQRLFVAGLIFIYTVWNSDELRRTHAPDKIVNTAQTCATTLAVLTGRFPSAAGCRDALETLVSATVKGLFSSQPPTFTGPKGDHVTQGSSTGTITEQLDVNLSMEGMYSMLSGDMFGMAQGVAWPGFGNDAVFCFSDEQANIASPEWSVFDGNGHSYNEFI